MSDGMSSSGGHLSWALGACAGLLLLAGCATEPPSAQREVRLGDNLNIYDMYDNSRPWGASYLVGPPMHHFGDGARIDDERSTPPDSSADDSSAADPNHPPSWSAPQPTLSDKPLPLLP